MKIQPAPIHELRVYLRAFSQRCRSARWLGALFHAQVAEDIAADVETMRATAHAKALQAAEADAIADEIIAEALHNGLDSSDIPKLTRARAYIRRSRQADLVIGETLKA